MNSSMRSWLASGAAAGSGRRVPRICFPSRLKMRSSIPPASASRASIGTSRRQSDDQSSEMTRIFAGPPGLGDQPLDGGDLVVGEARPQVAVAQDSAVVLAGAPLEPPSGK